MSGEEASATGTGGVSKWQVGIAVAGAAAAVAAGYLYYRKKGDSDRGSHSSAKSSRHAASSEGGRSSVSDRSSTGTTSASRPGSLFSGNQQMPAGETDDARAERAMKAKNRGNKHFRDANYDAAIRSYEEAISLCPRTRTKEVAAFHQNIAATHEQLAIRATEPAQKTEHIRTVVQRCTTALELNDRYVKAFCRRGRANQLLGNLETALEDVTAASIIETMSGAITQGGGLNESIMGLANMILQDIGKTKAAEYYTRRPFREPSKAYIKSYFESYQFDVMQCYDCEEVPSKNGEEEQAKPAGEEQMKPAEEEQAKPAEEEQAKPAEEEQTKPAEEDAKAEESAVVNGVNQGDAEAAAETSGNSGDASEAAGTAEKPETTEEQSTADAGDKHANYRGVIGLFRDHKFAESERACRSLLDGDRAGLTKKQEAHVYLVLATIHQLYSRSKNGMTELNKLIAMSPEDAPLELRVNGLVKRGSQHLLTGNAEEALADFQTAHSLAPSSPDVFHHRGQMHFLLDRMPEAIADYEQCAALSPDFPSAQVQLQYARYKTAAMSQSQMMLHDAMRGFEEVVKRFPSYGEGLSLYAQVLHDQGKLEESEKIYRQALELEPQNATLYVHHGLLLMQKTESYEEALKKMKKALDVDPDCDFAYETMATIEVQLGNVAKAVALWDKAIDLCRTEMEMAHLFSLREAAKAQEKVSKRLGVPTLQPQSH